MTDTNTPTLRRHWSHYLPEVGTFAQRGERIEATRAEIARLTASLKEQERDALKEARRLWVASEIESAKAQANRWNATLTPRLYRVGGRGRRVPLVVALKLAGEAFERTGNVLSIESA